jgi:signal transduction histidine kinase/CheY-like chemotaxis protein
VLSPGIHHDSCVALAAVALGEKAQARVDSNTPSFSDAAMAALLDSAPCGVLLFGTDGALRAVNGWFSEMLGRKHKELLALGSFEELVERLAFGFAEPNVMAAHWRERRRRGQSCRDELRLISPTQKILERHGLPIMDPWGQHVGWMELYRDVTSQKLSESKMFHTERMVALGRLVASVAHEMSNPLTSILGYAQRLLRRRDGVEREEDVGHILQEAERASRIAKNLLQFARGAKAERAAVDLNEVVRRALALRAYELRLEEIEAQLELEPELPPVLGDAAQLQQVLLNLLVNAEQAIQHGRGRGNIRLQTRRVSGDRLAVGVIDDGPGIAPESLPRIFDPFFTTKPAGVGTGLGLSIAYGIAREHGGAITVESRQGSGAVFTVELPVAQAPPLSAKSLSQPQGRSAGGGAGSRSDRCNERILVVEDEPVVARLIADVLAEEGHCVDVVLDSREGLERIERRAYGLVICDLRMPYLGGRALFQELLRRGHPLGERFVFVTGDVLSPHIADFLRSSGAPFLAKPFLLEELKGVVHRALDHPAEAAPVGTTIGGRRVGRGRYPGG